MPRAPRIQYEGATYHIMARGDRREPIVFDDLDRRCFVDTLGEVCQWKGVNRQISNIGNVRDDRPSNRWRVERGHPAQLQATRALIRSAVASPSVARAARFALPATLFDLGAAPFAASGSGGSGRGPAR